MERWHLGLSLSVLVVLAALPTGCSRSTARETTEGAKPAAAAGATSDSAGSCALVSQSDVAAAVGNAVEKGEQQGSATCKWDTANPEDVSVLLIVHRKGDTSEPYLCGDLRKKGGNERIEGLDVATWNFTTMGIFNSGNFDGCGPKGYLTLQLSGKRDEAQLKKATFAIAGDVLKHQ